MTAAACTFKVRGDLCEATLGALPELRGEVGEREAVLTGELRDRSEFYRVTVSGDVVTVEPSIQGTFKGPLETPAGTVKPTGAKIDVPTADFWYLRNGKIAKFNCYVGYTVMFAQMGVNPDWASAVAAS